MEWNHINIYLIKPSSISTMGRDDFIGREEDLSFLRNLYDSDGFSTCAILGRRRIGKTRLLEEFCKDKRHLFFRFRRGSLQNNLIHMSRIVGNLIGTMDAYGSLEEALDAVADVCREEKTVVVFDEYPFISEIDVSISSDFQHFVDIMNETDSMTVFCGSSVSSMQAELYGRSSPLYGRILAKRTIGPLSYDECRRFHPGMAEEDLIRLYLTVGGVPLYHRVMREGTYRECIAVHFLGNDADLDGEAANIIDCELYPGDKYSAVVEAIADGCTSLKRISERTGFPKASCSRYLDALGTLGIVDRIHPMSIRKSMKAPYAIADGMVAFGYLLGNRSELRHYGDPLGSFDALHGEISAFLGFRFERMCADYIRRNYLTSEIGKWWGRACGEETDVDIVAKVSENGIRYTLYCECKFRGMETTYREYEMLKDRVDDITGGRDNIRLMMFSLSGFSESLKDAEDPRLTLVDLDALTGKREAGPL